MNIQKAVKPKIGFRRRDAVGWLLLLPIIAIYIVFSWEPLIAGIRLSFYETQGFDTLGFVGLQNYIAVIKDPLFITALKNTFMYLIWSLLLGLFFPVIVAVMINEMRRTKQMFQFAVYFPNMVPGIATSIMWMLMMEPGSGGILNYFLGFFGIKGFGWLNNTHYTIFLIVVTITWRCFGQTTILYLANLQSVNTELYEAASLDGAGVLRKAFHITLPHLSGLIGLMAILQVIGMMQIFDAPYTMTGGGPDNASITLGMLAYHYGFENFRFDMCAACGMIIAVLLSGFSVIYFRKSREDV